MKFVPHEYQRYCVDYIKSHPVSALFLDMGLGKTVTTLTALRDLMLDELLVSKALVIAPLRVARDTWPAEVEKWDHLSDLDVSVIVGSVKERAAAVNHSAMIYVMNRENVKWLVEYYEKNGLRWDFDCVVIDELSSFKNYQSQRFKWLRKVRPFVKRWVGLTGTPTSNGLMDLWAEIGILDGGERLGRFIGRFRDAYFKASSMNPSTGVVFSYVPRPGAEEQIYDKISDITISMKALDYLDMPECIYVEHKVVMSDQEKKLYDQLKRDLIIPLEDGDIDAANAAALSNKLLQMSNGAVYDENGETREIHSRKLEALEDLIEAANGQPVLIAYWFKHDRERIMKHLTDAGYSPRDIKSSEDIRLWNSGDVPVALIHPASAGHGLNIQTGGHILIWFGLTWSLELYQQTNARLWRQVSNQTVEPCSYLTDEQVISHASASESGEKFKALYEGRWEEGYDSQSDADMALVSILAFWCGNVEEQIDRIFRSSGLMRDKWDRQTGDATYGQITVRNAVSTNTVIYSPIREAPSSAETEFSDLDEEETQASFEPDLSKVTLTLEEMQPHTNPRYQREEIGIGYAFADYFKPIARFDRERGIWYVFDGKVWQPDENALAVAELAKRLADRLYTFALQVKDEDTRNRYIKRVQKLQMRKNRRTMIEDAKSVYPVPHSVFDRNTDLFNCQNGTLNLTTGEFKPHDPADFLTLMSGITYDPEATCHRWDQFITEVMMNDADLALYLQKALGYALTGDTSLECLFILYGATSRNGKGTTMETFLKIMGDYGKTSNPEMLSTKFGNTNASGPSEEIARLAGVRFVNISEPEKKITFNAALVKRMTGNDTLNARFLHENSFDFKPNFKIFINTNYKPSVSDMTLFYSNRLKLIPFKRHFEEHEQDKGLKNFFAEAPNLSAIFNWCLAGYRAFRAEGLSDPTAVTTATKEYQEESDRIGQFVDAWLEEGEAFEVRTSAAYKLYGEWCDKYGYRKENSTNFNNAIQRFFPIQRKRPNGESGGPTTMLIGCRFLEKENGEPEEDNAAFS